MKQLAIYVVNKIKECAAQGGEKLIVRVDGFEDLYFYRFLCSNVAEFCLHNGIDLIAKLARQKFDELKDTSAFDAQEMRSHGWVDLNDHMTYYRNSSPSGDKPLLILLLGTDMVADKGGLNDFFAITPHTIDTEIGNHFDRLISQNVLANYTGSEVELKAIVNHFFGELFSCIPKNLCHLSRIIDKLETDPLPVSELLERLYMNLPECGIPMICDARPTLDAICTSGKKKANSKSIIKTAHAFIKGKLYARVTAATLKGIQNRFAAYQDDAYKKYTCLYPDGQAIGSLTELQDDVIAFVSGRQDPERRNRLLRTDYSIIHDVLNAKLKTPPPPVKPKALTGMPLCVFSQALFDTIFANNADATDSFNYVEFQFAQAKLCGIPSGIDAANADSNQEGNALLEDAWKRIAYFAGGIVGFLNQETWELPDGTLFEIKEKNPEFFNPTKAAFLRENGFLARGSGSKHKLEFSVALLQDDTVLRKTDYLWTIDPQEDWVMAFALLQDMPDCSSYVPYHTMGEELNAAFCQKDDESFAYFMDHATIAPLAQSKGLVQQWNDRAQTHEEKEEAGRFALLGTRFQEFRKAVLENGFYSTIGKEADHLVDCYIQMADRISGGIVYDSKMRSFVQLFVNAFAICRDVGAIANDIFTPQMIIPPYHPAALEKVTDRMVFIRAGLKEWYADPAENHSDASLSKHMDTLLSLSNVHSAIDAYYSDANKLSSFSKTHGYYVLYGTHESSTHFISSQDVLLKEAVFDDDFDDRDMKRLTREARVIKNVLQQYSATYTRGYHTLSLTFINPQDLQVVVSALYHFIEALRKDNKQERFSLEVTIITKNELHGARTYLAYWINNVFTSDDNIDIKAYLRLYSKDDEIKQLIANTTDVCFFFDALNTDGTASFALIRSTNDCDERMMDCRFPMVFRPSIAAFNAKEHHIVITQPQFRAASAHTQVLRAYSDHQHIAPCTRYDLVQSSVISAERGNSIQGIQDSTVWLACIDAALDKQTVREMYAEDTGIIGFTTGEGSFGQLNMALTCKPEARLDMQNRCKAKLRNMFASWQESELQSAAEFCVSESRNLDGVSLLRAMNPNDYEINNYLAYLFAHELLKKDKHQLDILIRLDSYRHWFPKEEDTPQNIPDFLHLTADITPGSKLHLYATVIEAKIANTTAMQVEHLPKAKQQVDSGIRMLSTHFNPDADAATIEHRYWLAQLYRAIVFLQGDADLNTSTYNELNSQLACLLEGKYEITWNGRILAFEIDGNFTEQSEDYEGYICQRVGQLGIQNILLQKEITNTNVQFDASASVEEGQDDQPSEEFVFSKPVRRNKTEEFPASNHEGENDQPESAAQGDQLPTTDASDEQTGSTEANHDPEPTHEQPEAESSENEEPEQENAQQENAAAQPPAIKDVRVLIGKDKANHPVYWEFGHPGLTNRHLLITGSSGQGKTYGMQTFLYELARQQIPSVVFDYTDGFLPSKLEKPFADAMKDRITQHIAIIHKIPINPFKRQTTVLEGFSIPESSAQVASRFAAIMKHVYQFGEQQYSALYKACREGIDEHGDEMDFYKLQQNLENANTNYAKTVLSKMQQLFDMDLFDTQNALDWAEMTKREGRVTVIQLTTLDRVTQTIITEMLMWDAWYALVKAGTPTRPFVVVLDEAQNLSFADGSPAQKILQEGRKYGWSAWFATQFLKGALSTDEISRLQQAAETLYFKPSNEEATWVAQQVAQGATSVSTWVEQIKRMQKGQCIVHGDRILHNNTFGACPDVMVKVSSFEDRG